MKKYTRFCLVVILLAAMSSVVYCSGQRDEKTGTTAAESHSENTAEEKLDYVKPYVIQHNLAFNGAFNGLVETGFDNKLLTLNSKNEFCYLNLEIPDKPRLEVITPDFPAKDGWGGELGSDAENHVAWCVRGRGVYFIDLESKKTGEVHLGLYGDVKQVLLTDKERLLFLFIVFSVETSIQFAYELSTGTDYGEVGSAPPATYNTIGKNRILIEVNDKKDIQYSGWYLTDSFLTNIKEGKGTVFPGGDPLTKALTDNNVHAINKMNKLLDQRKRLLFAWSYVVRTETTKVLVRWSEDLKDVHILPIPFMYNKNRIFYEEPSNISADGNWFQGLRSEVTGGFRKVERIVCHLQDYYPGGISLPVSLGYTKQEPEDSHLSAFMNHSKLGPCFVEDIGGGKILIFMLNDAIEILKRQEAGKILKDE